MKKIYKPLFATSAKKVELVEVPRLNFLMIDGAIEPGRAPGTSPLFQENMQAIYGAAYTLKFMVKQRKENPVDYPVMALEGLWWVEDDHFDITIKDNWFYTVMILQPDLLTADVFAEGLAKLRQKKGEQTAFARLRLESFGEGLCMQTMHIGPYDAEPATVAKMDAFAAENGYVKCGKHHEIYMSDPRRVAPEKNKTILRQPVKKP